MKYQFTIDELQNMNGPFSIEIWRANGRQYAFLYGIEYQPRFLSSDTIAIFRVYPKTK